MAGAYTPGLTVSGDVTVRKVRRLPIKGETLVSAGDLVEPGTVVARAMLPGPLQTMKLAEKLGLEPKEVAQSISLKVGDSVQKGQVVAETKGLFGMFKQQITSEFDGTIEAISDVTGNALVREPSIPVEVNAYVKGTVAEVLTDEGAIIETRGAMVQGIFGVGGERTGVVKVAVPSIDKTLEADAITEGDKGKILVGGSGATYEALQKATLVGAAGVIVGGVRDADLTKLLGYEIGVAITGQEQISFTLVVTEGFGFLPMAERTFALLKTLEGQVGSINGATQIRAGVIRPELIVPIKAGSPATTASAGAFELVIGAPIRVIREPYFGKLATVTNLPAQLVKLDSGAEVRVLGAKLADGEEIMVPRANVEIIAG